jgi:hypothetical protein
VGAPGPAAPAPSAAEAARLARKPATATYDRELCFVPFGSEAGFRPDTPPVQVREAAARNVLLAPPWGDEAALATLLADLATLPADCAFWLRAAPGEGPASTARLAKLAATAGLDPARLPPVWVIDAQLAPDREAGLYVAADAVLVEEAWPDADRVARRAADCGIPVLDGAAAARAWLATAPARDRAAEAALGTVAPDR